MMELLAIGELVINVIAVIFVLVLVFLDNFVNTNTD